MGWPTLALKDGRKVHPTTAHTGNIELLIQRGEKLEDLDTAAVVFNDNAREFQKGATGVNRKMSWKKWKVGVAAGYVGFPKSPSPRAQWYLVCIIIALIICSGLIVAIVLIVKK